MGKKNLPGARTAASRLLKFGYSSILNVKTLLEASFPDFKFWMGWPRSSQRSFQCQFLTMASFDASQPPEVALADAFIPAGKFEDHGKLRKRIQSELRDLILHCYNPVVVAESVLHVTIDGPQDSVYAGGKFQVEIRLPDHNAVYPFQSLQYRFLTNILHPCILPVIDSAAHINEALVKYNILPGAIDLLELKDLWSPIFTPVNILGMISWMLRDPVAAAARASNGLCQTAMVLLTSSESSACCNEIHKHFREQNEFHSRSNSAHRVSLVSLSYPDKYNAYKTAVRQWLQLYAQDVR